MSGDRTVPAFRREDGRGQIIQGLVQQASQRFDPDAWAAMDKRDNALVEDEIVHGAQSSAFVYSIPIGGGKRAEGVTVVGARQLAAVYQGIQATVISTLSKRGSMFISRSFPYGGYAGKLEVQQIPELKDEEDFYEVMIEVHDLKTSNKIPSSRREYRYEKRSEEALRRNPTLEPMFERQHLEQIAFSKAYRNGVVSLIPQDAVLQFKAKNLALNTDASFVGSLMEEKRSGVLRYAAARAIGVDRTALEELTFEQISGLADAAREGSLEGFVQSASALGIVVGGDGQDRTQQRRVAADAPKSTADTKPQVNGGQQQNAPAKEAASKQQDGKPAETAKAVVDKQVPSSEQKATPPKQDEQQKPPFDEVAFDASGERVMDDDGFALQFTRAEDFALWYRGAWAASKGNIALAEHNADALACARLDPASKAILDAIEQPDEAKTKDEPKVESRQEPAAENPGARQRVVLPRLPGGGPDWVTYDAALAKDLETIATVAAMEDWIALNEVVFRSNRESRVKTNYAGRIAPMIDEKMKALQTPSGPPRDHDMERAEDLIRNLAKVTTQAELDQLGASAAVKALVTRWSRDRPDDITPMLRAANEATEARVKGRPLAEHTGEPANEKGDPESYEKYAGENGNPADEDDRLH